MIHKKKADEKSPYTKIGNGIFHDKSLSFKAIGIYCLIWSLPEKWDLSASGLSVLARDNPASIKTGLKELETAGYIRIEQSRKGGKFSGNDCLIYESPLCDFTSAVKPSTEKPSAENHQQEIKDKEMKNKEKKKEKTSPSLDLDIDIPEIDLDIPEIDLDLPEIDLDLPEIDFGEFDTERDDPDKDPPDDKIIF